MLNVNSATGDVVTKKADGQDQALDHSGTTEEAALTYIEQGFAVVPMKPTSKQPCLKWKDFTCPKTEVSEHFSGKNNIALKLGKPSGGLVDVDLGLREAKLVISVLAAHV